MFDKSLRLYKYDLIVASSQVNVRPNFLTRIFSADKATVADLEKLTIIIQESVNQKNPSLLSKLKSQRA